MKNFIQKLDSWCVELDELLDGFDPVRDTEQNIQNLAEAAFLTSGCTNSELIEKELDF